MSIFGKSADRGNSNARCRTQLWMLTRQPSFPPARTAAVARKNWLDKQLPKKIDNRSSENKTKVGRVSSNKLKYEKTSVNKTYSNEAKQDQKCNTDSKPVSDEEKQKHQKSSLVKSVSNIFRSLLEL